MFRKKKIVVILGPTSSGKSEVAIRLAKKFNGEIISADSRQIYRGMDIGTGKITKEEQKMAKHHMLDIASPKTEYNVSKFKKDAEKIIANILSRGKVPIICGGTGFWIKAIVDNVSFPEVKPDWKLRKKLAEKSITELIQELKSLDLKRAKSIDAKNKVRLIRAIEICKAIGKVPDISSRSTVHSSQYEFLQIGIDIPKEKLQKNIQKRLKKRFSAGMITEVKKLKKSGLSWKKIQSFGLGYFWIPLYLHPVKSSQKRGAASPQFNWVKNKEDLFEKIYSAEKDYAKRQLTWFRKDKRIKWLKDYKEIEKETFNFIKIKGF